MKININKSITVLALALFFSFTISAKEDGNPKAITMTDANQVIKEHVIFPNVLLNYSQEEKVNVVFTVNELGQVNLAIASSSNDALKKSIESQFLKLKIKNLKANNAYSVVINFKTI